MSKLSFDIEPFLCQDDPWIIEDDWHKNGPIIYDYKYRIVSMIQPKSIVEIGVRFGYSAAAMLSASPEASYCGIDADNQSHGGVKGAHLKAFDMFLRFFRDNGSIEIKNADTNTINEIPHGELIHIDGDHSYNGCAHDLRLAYNVQPKWILVDDYNHISDVRDAVINFIDKFSLSSIILPSPRGDALIQVAT